MIKQKNLTQSEMQMVKDFRQMTTCPQKQSISYLTKAKWNFQNSINMFFDSGQSPEVDHDYVQPQVETLFNKFSVNGNNGQYIDDENFIKFIEKILKWNSQSVLMDHLIINIMEVETPGIILKSNFSKLFQKCNCKNSKNLANKMPALQKQLLNSSQLYKNMYEKMYKFYLQNKQVLMNFDTAVQIWKIYLKPIMSQHLHQLFISFLQQINPKPNKVHKDLWKMVFQFAINVKNLQEFKQSDGYPVLLDQFAQFAKKKKMK